MDAADSTREGHSCPCIAVLLARSDEDEALPARGRRRATSLGASIAPYPFRLDPFLALLGRVSAFWPAPSAISAGFTSSRSETTSLKARRYRDRALLCRPVFVFTGPESNLSPRPFPAPRQHGFRVSPEACRCQQPVLSVAFIYCCLPLASDRRSLAPPARCWAIGHEIRRPAEPHARALAPHPPRSGSSKSGRCLEAPESQRIATDHVSEEGPVRRSENPGVGGSIPSQPTIRFSLFRRLTCLQVSASSRWCPRLS